MSAGRASILDVSWWSFIGVFWMGYAVGLAVASHWESCAIFATAGVLALLWGEGVRLAVKR